MFFLVCYYPVFLMVCLRIYHQRGESDTTKNGEWPMPKRIQPLSDLQIKNAKPRDKDYKLTDGFGLHLLITPTGGKLWRFQYRYAGKQKLLSFGAYPSISLVEAREKRETARKQLANEIDPGDLKKAQKAARIENASNSFESVTDAILGKM